MYARTKGNKGGMVEWWNGRMVEGWKSGRVGGSPFLGIGFQAFQGGHASVSPWTGPWR